MHSYHWPGGKCMRHFLDSWHHWAGGPKLYLKKKKKTRQPWGASQQTSISPWSLPQYLSWLPALISLSERLWPQIYKPNKPSLLRVALGRGIYVSSRKKAKTISYDGWFHTHPKVFPNSPVEWAFPWSPSTEASFRGHTTWGWPFSPGIPLNMKESTPDLRLRK